MPVADPTLNIERHLYRKGAQFVIGCDEVGRGAIAGPVAVGLSVVVIAWHYPSDVIGGMLVAAGWGFAVLAARRAVWPREPRGRAQCSRPAAISVK